MTARPTKASASSTVATIALASSIRPAPPTISGGAAARNSDESKPEPSRGRRRFQGVARCGKGKARRAASGTFALHDGTCLSCAIRGSGATSASTGKDAMAQKVSKSRDASSATAASSTRTPISLTWASDAQSAFALPTYVATLSAIHSFMCMIPPPYHASGSHSAYSKSAGVARSARTRVQFAVSPIGDARTRTLTPRDCAPTIAANTAAPRSAPSAVKLRAYHAAYAASDSTRRFSYIIEMSSVRSAPSHRAFCASHVCTAPGASASSSMPRSGIVSTSVIFDAAAADTPDRSASHFIISEV